MLDPSRGLLQVLFAVKKLADAEVLQMGLRESGFRFDALTCDCRANLQKVVSATHIAVIVGDYGLSDWSGQEMVRWLQSIVLQVPLIVLNRHLHDRQQQQCRKAAELGLISFVKPKNLHAAFGHAVRRSQVTTERDTVISELLSSQEKFSKTFRLSPIPSYIATVSGRIIEANEALVKLTEIPKENVLGELVSELGIWPEWAQYTELWDRAACGIPVRDVETRVRSKDGQLRTVRVFAELIPFGTQVCILVLADDITDMRELEDKFRHSQKMEALGLLSGGIAHDFNNLLGVILGNVDLAAERAGPFAPAIQHNLQQITTAANDGVGLCKHLLAFSRKTQGATGPIDLGASLRSLISMLRRLIGDEIALIVDVPDQPAYILADSSLVNQAITNLVVNSRDSMSGEGRITIRVGLADERRDFADSGADMSSSTHIVLSVSDTGHGMDRDTESRIFEPFFTTKTEGRGTGLGLVMVQGLISQVGGIIRVRSILGEGTTFQLYFPRVCAITGVPATGAKPFSRAMHHESVLVVEDKEALLEATCSILRNAGYEVFEAKNSVEARGMLKDFLSEISLILIDVGLPTESGPSLIFNAPGPLPPVLFMSGYSGEDLGKYGLDRGKSVLQKPFDKQTLLGKVRETLDRGVAVPHSVSETQG